jgi:fructokinase
MNSVKEIMTSVRPCIVGFGEFLWDVLPHATLPGGAPANFVWHAQQLGAHGALVSAIGNDQEGRDLAAWLEKMGLSADDVQVNCLPTGRVDVRVSSRGEPGYVIHEGSAWDSIVWVEPLKALARRADCVCFGSLAQRSRVSRETLQRFLHATRPECVRIFDVNLRHPMPAEGIIEQSMRLASVLKLNEEEWPFVAKRLGLSSSWEIGCRALLRDSTVSLVAMTRGAQGSVMLTNHQHFELPADPIEVNDTVGAGDAFSAALATGLLRGMPLREIQIVAMAVSAYVCTQEGATPRMPEALKQMATPPTASVLPQVALHRSSPNPAPHAYRAIKGETAELP